jgi:hypothetical protein
VTRGRTTWCACRSSSRTARTADALVGGAAAGDYFPGSPEGQVFLTVAELIGEAYANALDAPLPDGRALDALAELIGRSEWSADLMTPVLDIIAATGRAVPDN